MMLYDVTTNDDDYLTIIDMSVFIFPRFLFDIDGDDGDDDDDI